MSRQVGAYEAKAKLSELLDRVARGERFTITRHGVPVAEWVPVAHGRPAEEVAREIREFRRGRRLGKDLTLRELIETGRDA
ncbi:MAG: type II toxin-antitoxin system prevent-host-death family antitoxin [Bacillota bacterium]|nr:type II toxin-antitoxin system prevent-host-death family antitoxin [Bacillota bacterium]